MTLTWATLMALLIAGSAMGADQVVIIDPGHGGAGYAGSQKVRTLSSPNNATSPSGLKEKQLTLELALEVKKQVKLLAVHHPRTKLRCVLTRTSDVNLDFGKRAAICARVRPTPSAIISLHFNASKNHKALGSLAVVNHPGRNPNYTTDRAFAIGLTQATSVAIQKFIPRSHPRKPITDAHLHRGVGSNFFYQLARYKNLKKTPRCFLEIEFIDRVDVDRALLQRRKTTFPVIARAIAVYLYQYCAN